MKALRIILKGLIGLLAVLLIPYYNCLIYDRIEGTPFNGDEFYNPYEDLSGDWIRGNFHAHTTAHLGLTEGHINTDIMLDRYNRYGYELPVITNYSQIHPNIGLEQIYMPGYEHGVNLAFNHQLVLNAQESTWFDYMLPFFSQKQHMLNRLQNDQHIIAYAHPNFLHRMQPKEFEYLCNYEIMEIISPRAHSFEHWDAALSTGHLVWGMSNDDAHDTIPHECGICWNWLNVSEQNKEGAIQSLLSGRFYGVKGWVTDDVNFLKGVSINGKDYQINLRQRADSVILIGDWGRVLHFETDVTQVNYSIPDSVSYVRTEVVTSTTGGARWCKQWINPVVRTAGGMPDIQITTEVNYWKSVLYWLFLALIHLLILRFFVRSRQR